MLFADTSALARMYLGDEPEADALSALLRDSGEAVVASELVRVELARATASAVRARRAPDLSSVLRRIDDDIGRLIGLVDLRPREILPRARDLVLQYRLGTLDAIHLAVALDEGERSTDPVVFVTRDRDQAAAAKALGFELV